MNLPQQGDYIDMHTHGGKPASGIFLIESLMAHEKKVPENISGITYTFGIHPWFLNEAEHVSQLSSVEDYMRHPNIIAVGEAGFDKLRGPSLDLQRKVFEEQVKIAEEYKKPLIIHCVRAWEELLASYKRMKPEAKWLIHGFRGNKELAFQLLSKGLYLSVWFDFAIRPESANLLKALPKDKFFLETDGADIDIRKIYEKVAADLRITVEELKAIIFNNYYDFFG
jgi:TatD DNase family protein